MDDNIDDVNSLLSIESRQRRERKEMQAKIQGLKKAAKNDKSKKKDLTAEIARLEADLEARHSKEIEELQKECYHEDDLMHEENGQEQKEDMSFPVGKANISKTQKRRNKKIQQDREREEQIKLQEKENRHGPRNVEIQAISTRLKKRNLTICSIPSDGDCLYKAIAHQLTYKRNNTVTVEELRRNVSNHIRNNKDDFLPFLTNPDTFEMLTPEEFEGYCDKICDTKVWGGQLEVRALSNFLKCQITIIQATGPEAIEQGDEYDGPPLIITYHRHMYSLGEHYNSTQSITQEVENEDLS